MRVLIISSLYGPRGGGAGMIAHHIAHALKDAGNQVSVITLASSRPPSNTEENGISVYRFQPINLYRLEEKEAYHQWQKVLWQILDVYNLSGARMLRKILEKESPDIIHIHKMRGFSGAVWSVAADLRPGRVIQTCHDYESMSPDGLLRGRIGRMALRQQWPVRGYQLLRKRLSSGVSAVTAPSRLTLRRITDSGLFPSAKSNVIPNTHGLREYELRSIPETINVSGGNATRFLFLGRLEREKGIIELCEAFLRIGAVYPSLQLDIGGWGTLEAELRQNYCNHPGINFLGVVEGKSKEQALRAATVVVVPSLVDEVFGLVTVEAFAYGKPVIASHIGGLPELVKQGETGWLVEAGNVRALAEQLETVANIDPTLLRKMSQNCKEYSYEFTVEKVLKEYLDLYHQLMK